MSTTKKLLKAKDQGAVVVIASPPYEGWSVDYQPRHPRDRAPWALVGTTFRFSGDELKAVTAEDCPNCDPSQENPDGLVCATCDGKGVVFTDFALTRKLGKDQALILDRLEEYGSWDEGCFWHYGSPSRTKVILESLVRRGLVAKTTPYDGAPPKYIIAGR